MARSNDRRVSIPELDSGAEVSYAVFHPMDTTTLDEFYDHMERNSLECFKRHNQLRAEYNKLAQSHFDMTAQLRAMMKELETVDVDLVQGMKNDFLDLTNKLMALLTKQSHHRPSRHRPSGQASQHSTA